MSPTLDDILFELRGVISDQIDEGRIPYELHPVISLLAEKVERWGKHVMEGGIFQETKKGASRYPFLYLWEHGFLAPHKSKSQRWGNKGCIRAVWAESDNALLPDYTDTSFVGHYDPFAYNTRDPYGINYWTVYVPVGSGMYVYLRDNRVPIDAFSIIRDRSRNSSEAYEIIIELERLASYVGTDTDPETINIRPGWRINRHQNVYPPLTFMGYVNEDELEYRFPTHIRRASIPPYGAYVTIVQPIYQSDAIQGLREVDSQVIGYASVPME